MHIIHVIAIFVSAILMMISGIYAYTGIKVNSVDSELKLGAVNIALEHYSMGDKGEVKMVDDSSTESCRYLPGDTGKFSIKVMNKADPCYIRVKFKEGRYSLKDVLFKVCPNSDFIKKEDGYYYCTTPMNFSESKYMDYELQVLPTIDSESANDKNSIVIVAEAVQNKNFVPDFNSSHPWGNMEVEQCKNIDYTVSEELETPKVNLTYKNDGDRYIAAPENFLEGLKTIMPGAKLTYVVDLKNPDEEKTNLYFHTQINNSLHDDEKEILNKISLLITTKDGTTVYNGPVFNNEEILLGEYAKGDSDQLVFKLSVPADLKNDFSILTTNFTWGFSKEAKGVYDSYNYHLLKTGDTLNNISFLVFILSAACLTTMAFVDWRYRKRMANLY